MIRRILDSPWLYYGLAALLVVVAVLSQFEIRTPSRPVSDDPAADLQALRERDDVNVLFIVIDTLRADHLGSYGYERDTSPIMDQLAQYGVRFSRARSQSSWTKASMASLWMSAYPSRTGVTRFLHGVPEETVMPAEILRQAGFRTGGIFRNGWLSSNFGFSQGFEIYYKPVPSRTPEAYEQQRKTGHPIKGTDVDATEAAIEFLRGNAKERFFLYVHYMDVHQYLYTNEFALFGSAYMDAYDNALRWTDRNVAALIQALDELDLFDETIVVIGSDHGEAFLEHRREGHAQDQHIEVSHVPLIVSLPFRTKQPVVVEPLVRNIDIIPTLFDLLGLPGLPDAQGVSLVPLMQAAARGEAVEELAPANAFAHLDQTWGRTDPDAVSRPLVAVDEAGFRLIHKADKPDEPQLYDLGSDPGEQTNLAEQQPERVAELSERVQQYLAEEPGKAVEVELDEMELNQLRALGYDIE